MFLLPVVGSPFQARFAGPFTVTKQVSEQNYLISMPSGKYRLCHLNLLKPYYAHSSSSPDSKEAAFVKSALCVDTEMPSLGGTERHGQKDKAFCPCIGQFLFGSLTPVTRLFVPEFVEAMVEIVLHFLLCVLIQLKSIFLEAHRAVLQLWVQCRVQYPGKIELGGSYPPWYTVLPLANLLVPVASSVPFLKLLGNCLVGQKETFRLFQVLHNIPGGVPRPL